MAPGSPSGRILLVEGADDKHVVRHLCNARPDIPDFEIADKTGLPALVRAIGPEIKAPGRLAVGILADANDNPQARWQSIAGRLRGAGLEPPASMTQAGTIIEGKPRAGIWLMPDNGSPGELENFVAGLIAADDPVWPLASAYIESIPDAARRFKPGKTLRARLHAWLAARAEPRKMGGAIGAGDLDMTGPAAEELCDWLRQLFH